MADLPTYDYDIFLSHNHTDQEWTTRLAERLEQEDWQGRKLKVFFSPWDIRPGQSIPKEIENALPKSRKVGLIMSPNAVDSAWVELERLVTSHIAVTARDERLIPLYRRDCKIPALLQPVLYIDFRNDALFEESYQRLLAVVREQPLPRGSQSQLNATTMPPTEIPRPPIVGFVPRSSRDGNNLVDSLREELAPQKAQLIVLWGAGGVGKTTLAAEAARSLVDDFSHRVIWVSADTRTDLPFSTFLDEIARQLGDDELRKLSPERKSVAVRALVISQPTLIVLDNFETMIERQQCLEFLQHAQCSVLITTRQRLEHARSVPITGMSAEEARDFLQVLIEQTQDPEIFEASYRNRLIETAESNPLIMEWIVGQIDLANDPEEVLNDLTHGEGDAAHRVFDRSYNLPQLDDGGRAVLLALALFTPSAGRPTLAAVAGMDLGRKRDKDRFKKAQETLASLWLIKKMDGGLRLAVAGLTRELTKAHLATDPRAKTFPQRFVSRFLRYAQTHAQPTRKDYDALELEKDNMLVAADIAFHQGNAQIVGDLASNLALPPDGVLIVRGYWDEAFRIWGLALGLARSSGSERQIAAWAHNLAILTRDRGEFGEAQQLADESLVISRKFNDRRGMAISLHLLALLAQDKGQAGDARRLYEESLKLARNIGDLSVIAHALHNLGWLAHEKGEFDEAQRLYEESLEMKKKGGDLSTIGSSLHHLGWLAQDKGALEEARRLYEESLQVSERVGNQFGIATTVHQLAQLHFSEGNYEKAEALLQQSLAILRRLGDKGNYAECIESIGKLRSAQNRLNEASELLHEALELAQSLGIPLRIASVKHSLGLLAEKQDDKKGSAQLLREALMIFGKLGSPKAEDARRDLERIEGKTS